MRKSSQYLILRCTLLRDGKYRRVFLLFLRHYTGQKVEAALRKVEVPKGEKVVVNPIGYPPQFYWDVRNGLIEVSKRYERFLLDARKDLKSLKSISDSETVQQASEKDLAAESGTQKSCRPCGNR
jgi:hypothetical protein